jgi:hypothetical protein
MKINDVCPQGRAVDPGLGGIAVPSDVVSQDNDRLTATLAELIVCEGVRVGQVKTFSSSRMSSSRRLHGR